MLGSPARRYSSRNESKRSRAASDDGLGFLTGTLLPHPMCPAVFKTVT